ncbi:ribonuclease III [Rugamonas sp. A1-17]|nr:ribonuclease III [Rugamonas sp. A1-17]
MLELQKYFGHVFNDVSLLVQALTHKSCGPKNNERLEFLGDALLNCEVALLLFEKFDNLAEGNMSRVRAGMVRQETLVKIACRAGLAKHIRYIEDPTNRSGLSKVSDSVVADAVEAIYGAIYLDGGQGLAKAVIRRQMIEVLNNGDAIIGKDPKTLLQEFLQARRIAVPTYTLMRALSASQPLAMVSCAIPALNVTTTGQANTKKQAEAQAALKALRLCEAA